MTRFRFRAGPVTTRGALLLPVLVALPITLLNDKAAGLVVLIGVPAVWLVDRASELTVGETTIVVTNRLRRRRVPIRDVVAAGWADGRYECPLYLDLLSGEHVTCRGVSVGPREREHGLNSAARQLVDALRSRAIPVSD